MTAADPVNQRLADAHRRLAKAKISLEAASRAAEKGRGFLSEASLEVVEHVRRHEALAASRAAALREAMKLGDAKPFPTAVAPAKDRIQRLEAEDRQAVAKRVLHDLVAEEQAAQREVDEALAELNAAARAVISAELDDAVSKVAALELEVMQRRTDIEGLARSNVLGWGLKTSMSDAAKRLLAGNSMTDLGVKNSRPWARANEHAENWRARYEALVSNHAARRIKDHAPVATAARRMKKSAPADSRV
jgi:hypothetical protein